MKVLCQCRSYVSVGLMNVGLMNVGLMNVGLMNVGLMKQHHILPWTVYQILRVKH